MSRSETIACSASLCAALVLILLNGIPTASSRGLSPLVMTLTVGGAAAIAWLDPRLRLDRHTPAIAAALASWPVFFSLRTNWLNADGHMLTPKLERDVPLVGAHLTHDELLELFVHSRVWHYAHAWWGWSVVFSYQVISCVAGCAFVYVLLRLARHLAPAHTWLFVAGVASGAYVQLFFGDVENYTLTAVFIALYILAACRFIARQAPLWIALLTVGVAAAFHLEAAWLWPSVVYLCVVSRRRSGSLREAAASAAVGFAALASVFVYFHFNGLPLRRFFSSQAGQAARLKDVFSLGMPGSYFVDQARLLLQLCPPIAVFVPAVVWAVRHEDEAARFLAIAAASMLALQAVWKSQIGVFEDWNLYAAGGMLAAMLIWRYVSALADSRALRVLAAAVAALGSLRTYTWIVANHGFRP